MSDGRPARGAAAPAWDLSALFNAADPAASLAERHLWLVRLMEWLRHEPPVAARAHEPAEGQPGAARLPTPVRRLQHLLDVLERNDAQRVQVAALLARFWVEVDRVALFADFGFSARIDLFGEFAHRLRDRVLPLSPATTDLAELFPMLFTRAGDADWLDAIDDATALRIAGLVSREIDQRAPPAVSGWRTDLFDAIVFLSAAVGAAGFSPSLRQRMSAELLAEAPFRQLTRVAERIHAQARQGDEGELLREAQYLRALLDACRLAATSVNDHLEEHGISVDVVFQIDQLHERTHRIEELLNCALSREPQRDTCRLLADLARTAENRRSIRALFSQHYSLLARKVAERSAEKGEHYITRDRTAYLQMLRAALGGGAVIAVTTFVKFALLAAGMAAFWGGLAIGINYAASFVVVQLLHGTIATKQPAMTAPAMAEKLSGLASDDDVERFVDEVVSLIRSQAAGIFGNVAAVFPLVLAVQLIWRALFGAPLAAAHDSEHLLQSLTLLGPTPLYAAFTGVLLFASSLVAGWAENWFVWHRLDSAIAWNPRIVARLGAARAQRWGRYGRLHISGIASNVSLGLMLGLMPVVFAFFGLPVEVRHVTLSAGQLAAALGAEGFGLLHERAFWWCVAAIAATAALNLGVSFYLAFRLALRSRGIRTADVARIYRAIRRRMRNRPASFLLAPQ